MGNQLAGCVPTQILPVEHYLQEQPEFEYDSRSEPFNYDSNKIHGIVINIFEPLFTSLGSTRFFKVARVKYQGNFVVIKVFVLHDPTLPLVEHKEKLMALSRELSPRNNCLPFTRALVVFSDVINNTRQLLDLRPILTCEKLTDKAVFLIRQYAKFNCYDRISTRPFLTLVEKKWIAFQLLKSLQYCHSKGVISTREVLHVPRT